MPGSRKYPLPPSRQFSCAMQRPDKSTFKPELEGNEIRITQVSLPKILAGNLSYPKQHFFTLRDSK